MIPSRLFAQKAAELGMLADSKQQQMLAVLDAIWQQLQAEQQQSPSLWTRWRASAKREAIQGLYMWGGVGRGKTMLMDIFFQSLPEVAKLRMHYHQFMQMVHARLNQLQQQKNTLNIVASAISAEARVLCLDEFHVNDIGDAMILGNLLQQLFAERVVLITTSNRVPADLYIDGLQRERFLPAIALLQQHCQVLELDNNQDYRQLGMQGKKYFYYPHDAHAKRELQQIFNTLSAGAKRAKTELNINGRKFKAQAHASGIVWFKFKNLCASSSAQSDYLQLAARFDTLILSNIPIMDDDSNDAARRFLNLLDVLYDQRVRLIASARVQFTELYRGQRLAFEFDRATSRLIEMQSAQYLQAPRNS